MIKFNDLNSSIINVNAIQAVRVQISQKKIEVSLASGNFVLNYKTQILLIKDYTRLLKKLDDAEILLELPNDEPIDTNNMWRI